MLFLMIILYNRKTTINVKNVLESMRELIIKEHLRYLYTLMTSLCAIVKLLLTRFDVVVILLTTTSSASHKIYNNSTHRLYPCIILTHKRTHYFCACVKLSKCVFRCL